MNEVVNKFLLAGDKYMPEMHLKQSGFERVFFTLRPFLPCTPSCFLKASVAPAVQPNVSWASS